MINTITLYKVRLIFIIPFAIHTYILLLQPSYAQNTQVNNYDEQTKHVSADWRAGLPEPILPDHPGWIKLYYDAWRVADLKKIKRPLGWTFDDAFKPEKMWLWDQVWITTFSKYIQLAHPLIKSSMTGIDQFYTSQKEDGFISHVFPKIDPSVHNPIFTISELDYYYLTGDLERLKNVMPHLDHFYEWVKHKNSSHTGLYHNTRWKNGMDNRPTGEYIIDLTSQQAMVAFHLIKIAKLINRKDLVEKYYKEYSFLKNTINTKMWSAKDNFYVDLDSNFNQVNNWTVASFWPLIANVADSLQAAYLVAELEDENNFNTPHRVPTLGRKSSSYNSKGGDYWRGAVWAPTNAMVVRGLSEYGYHKLAREIVINHINCIYQTWLKTKTFHENYDQEYIGKPGFKNGDKQAKIDFVGWTGTGPIGLLIEYVIGIKIDAPQNTIYWRNIDNSQKGIRNLRWGKDYKNIVTLISKLDSPNENILKIEVKSNTDFNLVIMSEDSQNHFKISKGFKVIEFKI